MQKLEELGKLLKSIDVDNLVLGMGNIIIMAGIVAIAFCLRCIHKKGISKRNPFMWFILGIYCLVVGICSRIFHDPDNILPVLIVSGIGIVMYLAVDVVEKKAVNEKMTD